MASSYQDRINARRGTGVNKKKKKKVKPVSKDPRPKQSDIGKKYKNYGEFRQAVLAWKKRNDTPKKKKEYVSPKERKFGKDKLKINKEIEKNVDTYVKKMKSFNPNPVTKVDYPSKTEEKPKNVSNKTSGIGPVTDGNKYATKLKIRKDEANKKGKKKAEGATTTGGPVKSGVEYARSKGDDLAGYRRTKDTRITKKLKKAGFTEDRLARLRKKHADWKAKRKKKKKK